MMYHWTPDQVLELPVEIFDWLPAAEQAMAEAHRLEQRAEEARHRKPGSR